VRTTLTASDAGTGRCVDVLLELSPHDLVASLDIALRRLLPDPGPGLWLSGAPLDERSTLLQARVQTGCTLVLGGPAEPSSVPTFSGSGVELHVVGGPDAGRLLLLPFGEVLVGSDPAATVVLADREVAPEHLRLLVSPAGVVAEATAPDTRLDSAALDAPAALSSGQLLTLGHSLLAVVPHERADAATNASDDLGLKVNRPRAAQVHAAMPGAVGGRGSIERVADRQRTRQGGDPTRCRGAASAEHAGEGDRRDQRTDQPSPLRGTPWTTTHITTSSAEPEH